MEFSNDLLTIFIPSWLLVLLGFIVAFAITYISIPSIVTVARLKGFYDMPNGRTSHLQATPYLGGVGVFTGLIISTVVIAGSGFEHDLTYIIAGLVILLFIGLKDDMLMINPAKKLLGQIIASSIIIILGNIRIDHFHGVLGLEAIPYFASISFTIFVFIVIINGINLIDGIDGLASGVGILVVSALGLWFALAGFVHYSVMCFALSGSLVAFFYYNVFSKTKKIFLGDAGSLMVGLIVAVFIIRFLNYQGISLNYDIHSAPAIAFGLLIVPLYDTLRVFVLRISQGRSPFSADRQHIHHVLLDLGNNHLKSTMILLSANFIIIIITLLLQSFSTLYLAGMQIVLATGFSYFASSLLKRKRQKDINQNTHKGKQVIFTKNKNEDEYYGENKKIIKKRPKINFLNIPNV